MNAPLLSYLLHCKSNLSESSEFMSCDMFANIFRNGKTLMVDTGPKVSVDKSLI